jgi:hypothetical protein
VGVAPAGVFGLHSIEVTTGALIYLVSACGSGEEFVAAFRRYADRAGLFIPIADPIAVGRRGRFAVTLSDGGVMVEGEAEVVSSARTPSVLHGRVGMTLRFVSPDEQSRTVLVELEKARLAMKPPPPSVPPRPAEIPPQPRPVPPAPSGRIDATNALAECVAIGDVGALEVIAKEPAPRKTGQKFVVPTIRPIGPKGGPPAASTVYDSNVELPTIEAPPAPPRPRTELSMPVPPRPPTELSMPVPPRPRAASEAEPLPPAPGDLVPAPPVVAARRVTGNALGSVEVNDEPTDLSAAPLVPGEPAGAAAEPVIEPAELDIEPAELDIEPAELLTEPAELLTEPAVEALPPPEPPRPPPQPPRSPPEPPRSPPESPCPPPEPPRPPVIGSPPSTPVRPPNIEEPTPSGDWTMVPGADGPTIEPRTPKLRSESNWSISLAAPPKDEPRPGPAAIAAAAPPAAAPPARPSPVPRRAKSDPMPVVASTRLLESDPQRPVVDVAALSEPKVQVDPTLIEPLKPMPPEAAPPEAAPPEVQPSGSQPAIEQPMAASSSSGMRLQNLLTPVPGFMPPYTAPPMAPPMPPTPPPAAPVMMPGQSGVPMLPIEGNARAEATVRVRIPLGEAAPVRPSRRTQVIVVAVSAALVLAAAAVLLLIPRGDEAPSGPTAPVQPAVAPRSPVDAAAAPPQAPDTEAIAAAEVTPRPDEHASDGAAAEPAAGSADRSAAGSAAGAVAPPTAGGCAFDVASTPKGAEILLDKSVIGTTPTKLTLPCDVEHRLSFRKQRYVSLERRYTPTEAGKPLRVSLARPTYLVKVSSTPPGATVLVGGRSQGVTPTTIRLPVNETSTLTFTKEGFTSVTQKVTPKQNNESVSTSLKRAPRKPPR